MKNILLLFVALSFIPAKVFSQTDSTASTVLKLYNALDSKDKIERNKYKSNSAETRQGTLGKITVYKSTLTVPGFTNAEFSEGGGTSRTFTTEAAASSYDEVLKLWDTFNKKMHTDFSGGWTFTEYNEPRELYKSEKINRDGTLLSPVIRYFVERNGSNFRLILQVSY